MRFARALMRWALLAACGALAAPRPPLDLDPPLALQAIEAPLPEMDTFGYLPPVLASKYQPSLNWGGVADPRLYILTELKNLQNSDDTLRSKRKQPSLSIANPMEVLRQRLLLEIARKRLRDSEMQAVKNRVFLQNVGKRDSQSSERTYDDFSMVQKRGIFSKMADIEANRQKDVNDYLANGTNNL